MAKTIAIEINDAGLAVADDGAVLAVEPGYAIVESDGITTGSAAYAQARLKPSRTSNRHWSMLSLEDGSTSIPGVKNSAELAFAQLSQLWQRFESGVKAVILVVPSHYSNEQLGLLLGFANECGMPVVAMVDAAAAASVRPYPERQLVYVDAGLHRVSVTPLEQAEDVTALTAQNLENTGLAALMDAIAGRVAEIFVLATRFDPFHEAATEQLLYDGLQTWLDQLGSANSAELVIPYRDDSFSVELERKQVLAATEGFSKAVLQLIAQSRQGRSGLVVQLSDRLARFPGVSEALKRLDDALLIGLEPGHAARAALESKTVLNAASDSVKLYRHLPWRADPEVRADAQPPTERVPVPALPAATHVVYRGVAYPVNGEGLVIGRSKTDERPTIILAAQTRGVSRSHCELKLIDGELVLRDLSSFGTYINERRIEGEEAVHPADVIRVGSPGAEITVITVEHGHGA